MNECVRFMRLCLFRMFLITLTYAFNLLLAYELLFPSRCKNFHNAATMKSFNVREKAEISDNS